MTTAIIGGGIGGLAVAWNLCKERQKRNLPPQPVVVLEANDRFGGNADTRHFTFGDGPGGPINRWADLGVNDFNIVAYTKIVDVMNEIGYVEGKNYKPLEDSTSYYTGDGSIYFTDAKAWWGTQMDPKLAASVDSFMKVAGQDADASNHPGSNNPYGTTTIEEYINENTKKYGWDERLGPQVIYPRINGMYFVSELGPRDMPFLAVMHYYAIQEGAGHQPAKRRYFVGGTSTWIDALVNYMKANMPLLEFRENFEAGVSQVKTEGEKFYIQDQSEKNSPIEAQRVVFACHADQALKAMMTGFPPAAAQPMAKVGYNNGISVAHTDSRLLPVNRNAWSTYNIVIHEPGSAALKPYVINYVANRHQNDAENKTYDHFGLPEFFVSVNPQIPVQTNMILKDVQGARAMTNLRHNDFGFDTMWAQSRIATVQGVNDIYYAGGWTHGSGLHEECWTQGIAVAEAIVDHEGSGSPSEPAAERDAGTFVAQRLRENAAAA